MGNHAIETFSLTKVQSLGEKVIKVYGKYQIKDKNIYRQLGNVLPVSKRIQIELSDHYTSAWICVNGFRWVKFPLSILLAMTKSLTSGLTLGVAKSAVCYEVSDKKYTSKEFRKEIEKELENGLKVVEKLLESNKNEVYKLVSETNRKNDNTVANDYVVKNNLTKIGLINISCIDKY